MDGNFENFLEFDFFNYTPFFGQSKIDINPPILERLDGWESQEGYMQTRLEEMDSSLSFGLAEAFAIKIPKGQPATIKYDGIIGIYTPKVAPSLGGIANYKIGRIYPKEKHLIIFESLEDEITIEQNLVEDYHHVIFKFGKEIRKKTVVNEPIQPVVSQVDERESKIAFLERELQKLKEGS